MNVEKIIAEIEWLEHIYTLPDDRLPQMSNWKAANHCLMCGSPLVNDPLCTECDFPFSTPRWSAPEKLAPGKTVPENSRTKRRTIIGN